MNFHHFFEGFFSFWAKATFYYSLLHLSSNVSIHLSFQQYLMIALYISRIFL